MLDIRLSSLITADEFSNFSPRHLYILTAFYQRFTSDFSEDLCCSLGVSMECSENILGKYLTLPGDKTYVAGVVLKN
jgi:hypothetical protein